MKNKITVLLCLIFSQLGFANEKIKYGGSAGLIYSDHLSPYVIATKTNWHFSANIGYELSEHVAVTMEPGISTSNVGYRMNIDGSDKSERLTTYLNIPIYAKSILYSRLYLISGLNYGIKIFEEYKSDVCSLCDSELKKGQNDFDFLVGMGINVKISKTILQPEIKYSIGLPDINKGNNYSGPLYTREIKFGIGISR